MLLLYSRASSPITSGQHMCPASHDAATQPSTVSLVTSAHLNTAHVRGVLHRSACLYNVVQPQSSVTAFVHVCSCPACSKAGQPLTTFLRHLLHTSNNQRTADIPHTRSATLYTTCPAQSMHDVKLLPKYISKSQLLQYCYNCTLHLVNF